MGDRDIKPNIPPGTPPAGDGAGRRAGGGTPGGGGGRRQHRRHYNTPPSSGTKFVSRNKGIEHDIFDNTGSNDAAQFNKSLVQIADYLLEKLDHGRDVSEAIRNMTDANIVIPQPPQGLPDPNDSTKTLPVDDLQIYVWKDAFTRASKRKDYYDDGLDKAYVIIYNQCSPSLKNELESSDAFPPVRQSQNPIELLRLIQGLCCSYDSKTQSVMATVASHKRLYMHYQRDGVDNNTYYKEFIAHVETIETYGGMGSIGIIPTFVTARLKLLAAEGKVKDATKPTPAERDMAIMQIRDEYLGALMLSGCNRERFSHLRTDLQNQFGYGTDNYPKSPDQCLALLNRWQQHAPTRTRRGEPPAVAPPSAPAPKPADQEALVFAQDAGGAKPPKNDSSSSKGSSDSSMSRRQPTAVRCKSCGQLGHASSVCPDRKKFPPAQIHAMNADDASVASDEESVIILAQLDDTPPPARTAIDKDFLLLDSQSTVDLFSNPNHVANIRPTSKPIRVHCNKGAKLTSAKADFGNIDVYFDESGIANVLSLFNLGKKHHITYDSHDRGGVFQVHTESGILEFMPTSRGLHALNLRENPEAAFALVNADTPAAEPSDAPIHVNTVRKNFEGFTKHQIKAADQARRLMGMVATPSPRDFQAMVRHNFLKDCPVTNDDLKIADSIYGPRTLAEIRGKTARTKPTRVVTNLVDIPRSFFTLHNKVTLVADVMFVNGIAFLVSASRNINLITIEHAPKRTASNLGIILNRILRVYNKAGFTVQILLMDNEFDKVRDHVPTVDLNTPAASEHIGEIERRIRLIKERARGIVCTLPYPDLPQQIVIHLLHFVVMWLNNFPSATSGTRYSPREIILRRRLDYTHHCRAMFGSYCEVHEDHEKSRNSMKPRGVPAICLGPTGNIQGTYNFLSLVTGLVIQRRHFTELPVPQSVIDRVAYLARNSGVSRDLVFADRHRVPYDWLDNAPEPLDPTPIGPYPDIPAELPGVQLDRSIPGVQIDFTADDAPYDDINHDPDWSALADEAAFNADLDSAPHLPSAPEIIEIDDDDADDGSPLPPSLSQALPFLSKIEPDDPTPPATVPPQPPPLPTHRYPPRARAPPKRLDDYVFTTMADQEDDPTYSYTNASGATVDLAIKDEVMMAHVCHYVMMHTADKLYTAPSPPPSKKQYGLKAGLKRFEERGSQAIMKELTQFHTLECFKPKDPTTLSRDDRRNALTSLMFLTEKRTGEVKARACANGSTQRDHIAKEEATAPTVTSESIFIQGTIYAHENRDVATCDIPGAFLQADNPDYVLMRLDGILAELMVKVAPKLYRKFVTTNAKGKSVLYVQLEKAVYGMMKSALLFYRKLVADLTSIGYTVNPYDPCVANKIINGKQMTICWHVDDLFIGHADPSCVTSLLTWLARRYDTADKKLNVTRGPRHDYLGMNIDFSARGSVAFDMIPYINKVLEAFPEKINGVASSPASDHLFQIRPPLEAKLLPEVQARAYHHTTAQLLFLSRVRRDIQTTVAFLTTRVKTPDEDDWGKLKRVLRYLFSTRRLKLTLSADSLTDIKWYIDASHQTHDDCKGHTGSLLTFGKGATTSSSNKQKVPSKSSTESEIIGLHDKSSDVLWTRHFLEAQGYTIDTNIVYQDNMSTLSLAKNGYVSSSKRTKHIKAKYLYIRHYHKSGDLTLKYCPTDEMWADVLTKPLQGSKFYKMRAFLMNCAVDYSEEPLFTPRPVLQPISSNLPMKPRLFPKTAASPRECVRAQPSGTKVPSVCREHVQIPLEPKRNKVNWRDVVQVHHVTPRTRPTQAIPFRIQATAE